MTAKQFRLLDLFSGAGGAAMGYYRAGFDDITGIDNRPMKRYPFRFIQADALEYLAEHGAEYDVIHASPPCQAYSLTQKLQGNDHPDLVGPVRDLLIATGKPYVIENVKGAPLHNATLLVGSMFGLRTMRPRLFESNVPLPFVLLPPAAARHAKMGRPPQDGEYMHIAGHISGVPEARLAMGIDWMTQGELSEAIPPAYTEWIGRHLLEAIHAN